MHKFPPQSLRKGGKCVCNGIWANAQTQIRKYTNTNTQTQIHKYKYTNTQIHKYKYTNTQITWVSELEEEIQISVIMLSC